MGRRVGGIINIKADGDLLEAKGNWTYDLGAPQREAVAGAGRVHGFKETPKPAFVEGAITDRQGLDVKRLQNIEDATVVLELANGKTIVLRDAWYAGDGQGSTEEGELNVRFESEEGEEV